MRDVLRIDSECKVELAQRALYISHLSKPDGDEPRIDVSGLAELAQSTLQQRSFPFRLAFALEAMQRYTTARVVECITCCKIGAPLFGNAELHAQAVEGV